MTALAAPELAQYLDEPPQMRSGAPGKQGVLQMRFRNRGDRSILYRLHRRAPLLVQQALYWDEHLPSLPCVYVITTSGCVLQGDRLDITIDVEEGAMAHITTQAATKVHSMDANHAVQSQNFNLAENSYLEYLPGATIPHKHSRYVVNTVATVDSSATLLSAEIVMPGRKYHGSGEIFEYDLFSSATTAVRPEGRELFAERFVIEPGQDRIRGVGLMGRFDVMGNAVLVTPKENADRIFEQIPVEADHDGECLAGANRLPNDAGLIYRVLGMERRNVQERMRLFWSLVRKEVLGVSIPAPRLWG